MTRAVNDATLNKAGDIYQYLIALEDCFELNDDDTLQIEINGDVSIINSTGGLYQKEIKHHFGTQNLSDRDVDFWKTLANWYIDYERVKFFSQYILSTTAKISKDSSFYDWNSIDNEEKIKRLKNIGKISKKNEETFRNQYVRIFNDSYDEKRLLEILDKFIIDAAKTSIVGISNEFSKYIRSIPEENRDGYIGALLGRILNKVTKPPHKWEVTRKEFDEICQIEAMAYGMKGSIPLPQDYIQSVVPEEDVEKLKQKRFVEAIREIKYTTEITEAISDYWKTDMTVVKYFHDNLMYLESLDPYMVELEKKMRRQKRISDRDAKGQPFDQQIDTAQSLYDNVMMWDANDFGSIIRNQGFFQRGIIHNIVDETDFRWRVGVEKDEYC